MNRSAEENIMWYRAARLQKDLGLHICKAVVTV